MGDGHKTPPKYDVHQRVPKNNPTKCSFPLFLFFGFGCVCVFIIGGGGGGGGAGYFDICFAHEQKEPQITVLCYKEVPPKEDLLLGDSM